MAETRVVECELAGAEGLSFALIVTVWFVQFFYSPTPFLVVKVKQKAGVFFHSRYSLQYLPNPP